MTNLATRSTLISPPFDRYNDLESSRLNGPSTSKPTERWGCPSNIHFGNAAYTLGFGHLFAGNLQSVQAFNPICQRYEPFAFEIPECYPYSSSQKDNTACRQDLITNSRVDEAMAVIRKANHGSTSSILDRNQNSMTTAAALLERAANAVSMATQQQHQFQL